MGSPLLRELIQSATQNRSVAYCRLVETRGSTPQKPGATMLVYEDGSQAGTLGGGCVEAEVKRRAIAALLDHRTEIATFTLDHDYGWDDGLICGGRMQVLVRAVSKADLAYYEDLAAAAESGSGLTEAIVFDAAGGNPGDTFLLDGSGEIIASLANENAAESAAGADAVAAGCLLDNLRPLSLRPRPYNLNGVAYLPSLSRYRLVIVGGGHVGQAVSKLASELDFDVWVVDDRADCVTQERFPSAHQRLHGVISDILPSLEVTPETYCLIVTRGHNHDQEALFHLADRGARYVGMIGSRRKIKLIFENLLDHGIAQSALDRVYAPLGIQIGSQTVPEIAVSICAELVAHRNLGTVPGRATDNGTSIDPD